MHCIGTHEVQQISITSNSSGLVVSGEFIDESTSLGLLVIVYMYSLANNADIIMSYLTILRTKKEHKVSATFRKIPHGLWRASVFIIEENGLPFPKIATKVKTVQNSATNIPGP